MTVRAKFKVTQLIKNEGGFDTIKLQPVTSGSPENEAFYKWTPTGEITLSTVNVEAAKQFELGRQYYVDFTEAV